MKIPVAALLLSSLTIAAPALSANDAGSRAVVLVARADSDVEALTPTEIRRVFLGMPVYQDGTRLVPLLQTGDRLLYEIFLQAVMYLSATNYETQLVRRVFQYGGTRPIALEDARQFRSRLLADRKHIAFMWEADAQQDPAVRVVQVLWRGETN